MNTTFKYYNGDSSFEIDEKLIKCFNERGILYVIYLNIDNECKNTLNLVLLNQNGFIKGKFR